MYDGLRMHSPAAAQAKHEHTALQWTFMYGAFAEHSPAAAHCALSSRATVPTDDVERTTFCWRLSGAADLRALREVTSLGGSS